MLYRLIKNEYYKLLKMKKIYFFMLIIAVMTIIPVLASKFGGADIVMKLNTFPLENLSWSAEMIIPIFIVILGAEMITNEYNNGTFKLSLINSATRSEVLISKIIVMISFIFMILIFTLMFSYISGSIFMDWGVPFEINGYVLSEVNGILYTIGMYLLSIIPLTAFSILVMFISFNLSSAGSVVGINIGIIFFLSLTRQLSPKLSPFIISDYFNTGLILNSANIFNKIIYLLVISLIYIIIFYSISWINLKNKDIVK
jgi:ABC-type transport system involved in multi-copper enzyme maturation permease subunit